MDRDTILGIILTAGALGIITYLTFWSKRAIELIEKKHLNSAREILKDLHNGR